MVIHKGAHPAPEPERYATGGACTVTGRALVSEHPARVVTISVTVCVPEVLYKVDVFLLIEDAGLPPGMSQFHELIGSVGGDVLVFINVVFDPRQGAVLVKDAVGLGFTVAVRTAVLWQLLFVVAVSTTLYVPAEVNIWQGFCKFEILAGEPGSPKFHPQPVILPGATADKSVKQVEEPRQTGEDWKLAKGNGLTTAVCWKESIHPKLFVTNKDVV